MNSPRQPLSSLPPLPDVVRVFPLREPLLLPGTVVPLLAEEARYRDLLADALAHDEYVAVIQPIGEGAGDEPELFSVGCLGRIGDCEEEEPGQLLALVEGVIRFRVVEELPAGDAPYRRMRVDYGEFLEDPVAIKGELDFSGLRDVVRRRIEATDTELDLSIMDGMVGTEIVTALAHAMPFSPAERQALMETPSLEELEKVLLLLMATGPGGVLGFDLPPLLPS